MNKRVSLVNKKARETFFSTRPPPGPILLLMINNLTAAQQFAIIGQVFTKIVINFWPVLTIGAVACLVLARQESQSE